MELKTILAQLSESAGATGLDGTISVAKELLSGFGTVVDDVQGGLSVKLPGESDYTVMLDAHIDEIALIVTGIDNGFVRVDKCGGIDVRTLIGREVTIHGKEPLFGVFCSIPPHIKKGDKKVPELSDLGIDIGFSQEDAERLVSPGDLVTFRQSARELINGRITGKSLDNRAGVAALIRTAELIGKKKPPVSVIISLSAQEELGLRGAKTAAFANTPDEAIVVDVSFGDGAGIEPHECGKLGNGPMIGISPIIDRGMYDRLRNIADENKIEFQVEVMGGTTSTNADIISITKGGVKTALISIPLRNMHTATEIIDIADVEATAQLIYSYIMAGGAEND